MVNQHGLGRDIPADAALDIRQRSKFACVVCRSGFYTYEHIDPEFRDATWHDPEAICCLCGSCHDAVSRGRFSKAKIKQAYARIQTISTAEAGPPQGPLDFHSGQAYLQVGGIEYPPTVRTLLRYHGEDLIRVEPGVGTDPGSISAVFTDEHGEETLWLERNVWVGSLENWDIETTGKRLTVRRKKGTIALRLRLDPPGKMVIERLDMRIDTARILVTEKAYAIGRYFEDDTIAWCHANMIVQRGNPHAAVFDYMTAEEVRARDIALQKVGQSMATEDRSVVMSSALGVSWVATGMVIASLCGGFTVRHYAIGRHRSSETPVLLRLLKKGPEAVCEWISTADSAEAAP
ncbi:MAG: hypothetical protein Q8Q62_18635 [Mesorhizobium sp.]|nr:hypothetical protein [Mesorhizobium sp.]